MGGMKQFQHLLQDRTESQLNLITNCFMYSLPRPRWDGTLPTIVTKAEPRNQVYLR